MRLTVPPKPPTIRVHRVTSNSISLRWTFLPNYDVVSCDIHALVDCLFVCFCLKAFRLTVMMIMIARWVSGNTGNSPIVSRRLRYKITYGEWAEEQVTIIIITIKKNCNITCKWYICHVFLSLLCILSFLSIPFLLKRKQIPYGHFESYQYWIYIYFENNN